MKFNRNVRGKVGPAKFLNFDIRKRVIKAIGTYTHR